MSSGIGIGVKALTVERPVLPIGIRPVIEPSGASTSLTSWPKTSRQSRSLIANRNISRCAAICIGRCVCDTICARSSDRHAATSSPTRLAERYLSSSWPNANRIIDPMLLPIAISLPCEFRESVTYMHPVPTRGSSGKLANWRGMRLPQLELSLICPRSGCFVGFARGDHSANPSGQS